MSYSSVDPPACTVIINTMSQFRVYLYIILIVMGSNACTSGKFEGPQPPSSKEYFYTEADPSPTADHENTLNACQAGNIVAMNLFQFPSKKEVHVKGFSKIFFLQNKM